jgi:hypothetical protein
MANNTASVNLNAPNNDLVQKILAEPVKEVAKADILSPSDNLVTLPAGLVTDSGEVIQAAEVRELNGRDEEFIAKASSIVRAFSTILNRAVVNIGGKPVSEEQLDGMLIGDRDALLLGIFKATFGKTAELSVYCTGCQDVKAVEVDVDRDIQTKILVNPLDDRIFTVKGKTKEYLVGLPDGATQREMALATDKNNAELTTMMLERCIREIDGEPVISKLQVQAMSVLDRRTVGEEIAQRSPGPQFEDVTIICPDCESEVVVPISLGTLFRV